MKSISKFRLVINAVGTAMLGAFFLFVGVPGIFGIVAGTAKIGPDGPKLMMGIYGIACVIGLLAAVSCVRTVRALAQRSK